MKGKGTGRGGLRLNMYNFDDVYHFKNIDSLEKRVIMQRFITFVDVYLFYVWSVCMLTWELLTKCQCSVLDSLTTAIVTVCESP